MIASIAIKILKEVAGAYFGFREQVASTEQARIEWRSRRQMARDEARAQVLVAGAWRYQKPFIVILAVYFFAIVLDTTFFHETGILPNAGLPYEWNIGRLPPVIEGWAILIMSFLFLGNDK